jgi:hypothetical protein
MMTDMLGNQIAAGVGSVPDFIENHRAGRLRVLAVLGRARQAALPEVPSFGEMGLAGFDDLPYYGFWAPAGTPQIGKEEWDALTPAQRHGMLVAQGGEYGAQWGRGYEVSDDDDLARQFREQFGDTPEEIASGGFELNNQRQTGLRIGFGNAPQYGESGWDQVAVDPSRIMWLDPEGTENRRYVYEAENQRGDVVAGEQGRADDDGLGDNFWIVGIATVLGGGMLANALTAAPAAGAEVAATGGATTGSATGGTTLAEYGSMTGGLDGGMVAANPVVQGGGIVSEAATGGAAAAGAGGGGAASSIPGWSSLSPASQQLLTRAGLSAAGTAAQSVLGARAAEENRDFASEQQERVLAERREEEERARAEREGMRSRSRLNISVTPKTGLVNSQRGA